MNALDAEVEFAAYGIWQWNGRDVLSALYGVSRRHFDPDVRAAARQAYDAVRTHPDLAAAYTRGFLARARVEQAATRQRIA